MAATVNPDKPIRKARMRLYPKQIWWLLASFIALLALVRLATLLRSKFRSRSRAGGSTSLKSSPAPLSSKVHLRRIPLAITNVYRIITFRWTMHLDLGKESYTLNLAEIGLTIAYTVAIFTWAFINSGYLLSTSTSLTHFVVNSH